MKKSERIAEMVFQGVMRWVGIPLLSVFLFVVSIPVAILLGPLNFAEMISADHPRLARLISIIWGVPLVIALVWLFVWILSDVDDCVGWRARAAAC